VLVGKGTGGALAARFAIGHSDRVDRLVLVDSYGLDRFRPSPGMALAFIGVLLRPTERWAAAQYSELLLRRSGCRARRDGRALRVDGGLRPGPFPHAERQGGDTSLFSVLASAIPPEDLDRIAVPTTLIWADMTLGCG
jgi:pimeloyl-ACP methyl ester carboxylesterase